MSILFIGLVELDHKCIKLIVNLVQTGFDLIVVNVLNVLKCLENVCLLTLSVMTFVYMTKYILTVLTTNDALDDTIKPMS